MTQQAQPQTDPLPQEKLVYPVVGSRRPSVLVWAIILTGGGAGFTLAGLSSYLGKNLLFFSDPSSLIFIPQGVAMLFYGILGSVAGLYQWLSLYWNLGGGYNEFDKNTGQARIFRYGFPGKNREVEITFPLEDIQSVKVEIKEGFNPKRALFLKVKSKGDIPLTQVGQPLPLSTIENQGAEIARFLNVILEGI